MKTKAQVVAQLKKHLKESRRNLGKQRENDKLCRAFWAGDYMEYQDKIQFATNSGQKKRVTVQINKVKPYHAAVKGFLAQNRAKPNYIAQVQSSRAQGFYSQYCNTLSNHLRIKMRADQIETQQDGDMLMCGRGVVETAMAFGEGYASQSANGDIIMGCVDLDTYWYDAASRETGLLDRRYDGVTKQYELEEALELFSDSTEDDFEDGRVKHGGDYQQRSDLGGSYDRIKYDWADQKENIVNVHFYQWYDNEKYYRAENPLGALKNPESLMRAKMELETIAQQVAEDDDDFDPTAQILSFNADTKALLEASFGEFIEPEEFRRKVFYNAICSGDKCFKVVKSEHQGGFSRKVKTGDYDAKNKIWIGMINSMMEPQKYYNKALTELMFVIAANSKGGVIIEEGAVEDIEEFEDDYAKTDAVCVVRDGALSNATGAKIKDKRSPFQPTGYEQIIQIADTAIPDSIGVDKSFLGFQQEGVDGAALHRQRIRQIISTLACFMDAVCLYTLDHATMMLDMMRVYAENHRGELFPLTDDDSVTQFIEISEDKLAVEFYVQIEEAPVTPEERQEMADRLTAIGDKYLVAQQIDKANAFYALAAKYMALDMDDLKNITAILQPDVQPIDPAMVQKILQENQMLKDAMTQAQVDNVNAMTRKEIQSAVKLHTEAKLNEAKLSDVRAGVHKKAAETTKTLEDAGKTNEETKIIKKTGTINGQQKGEAR
jgi:putative component of toxin-antitoxin plasmid stabilization module